MNLFFLKNFQAIVIYIQFTLLLCSLLTVLGVIVLRWTESGSLVAVSSLGLSSAAAHLRHHRDLDDDLSLAVAPG